MGIRFGHGLPLGRTECLFSTNDPRENFDHASTGLGPSAFQQLPSELLVQIFGDIRKLDIKQLRQTCKRFEDLGAAFLFKRAIVSPHLKDLEVLSQIASHPILRHYVVELIYVGKFYGTESFPCHDSDDDTMNYLVEQTNTIESRKDVTVMESSFKRMPNIRIVYLTNHWLVTRECFEDDVVRAYEENWSIAEDPELIHSHNNSASFTPFGRFLAKDPSMPLPKSQPLLSKYPSKIPLQLRPSTINDLRTGESRRVDQGFLAMMRAVSKANTRIRSFCADYYGDRWLRVNGGLSATTFMLKDPQDLEHSLRVFRHLRTIDLDVSLSKTQKDPWSAGRLPEVLAAAVDLEELRVDFAVSGLIAPLEDVLGTTIWKNLRSVKLLGKQSAVEEYLDLVERQSHSLRHLSFTDTCLISGTWRTVAEKIRECLKLDSFEAENISEMPGDDQYRFSQVSAIRMKIFVFHGDPEPCSKEDREFAFLKEDIGATDRNW